MYSVFVAGVACATVALIGSYLSESLHSAGERLEEAVDHGCLEAMVSARRAHGMPLPKADDVHDREEFTAWLRTHIVAKD